MRHDHLALLENVVAACFAVTWIVLGIVSYVFFFRSKDAVLKRRWYPRFVILTGVLFVGFTTALMALGAPPSEALRAILFLIPTVSLICYLNIKFTRFCSKCGWLIFHLYWISPSKFCSGCGAEIEPPKRSHGDLLE